MTALTQARPTSRRHGDLRADPVAAGAVIYQGGIVCLNAAGDAVPGSTATDLTVRGIALADVDNSAGQIGDEMVEMETGEFLLENEVSDPVDRTKIGKNAYIVDDQTVAITDGGGTRSPAGRITDVNDDGVFVEIP